MMAANNNDSQPVSLKIIPAPQAAEVYALPVSGFPMENKEADRVGRLLASLSASMAQEWSASLEVFIQFNQLHLSDGARRFGSNAPQWKPKLGLGVWPDRDAPTLWTTEEFQKLQPGEKMRPMNYKVFQIRAPGGAASRARDAMLGLGTVVQLVTPSGADSVFKRARANFLPRIEEPVFRNYRFYVPLLDGKSLEAARAAEPGLLEEWLCGALAYIRESAEDKAILIVSLRPLAPIFERLKGTMDNTPEPLWRFPY